MEAASLGAYAALAEAFSYPTPGRLATLQRGLAAMPDGDGKRAYAAFIRSVAGLSLGQWEELHTRTLDLNPPAAPYVGYQVWGENYARGTFLSSMNRALIEAGIDTGGELPDHLGPVLRYLGAVQEPLPELLEALDPALDRMVAALRKAEPDNPYVSLLEAVRAECSNLKREAA